MVSKLAKNQDGFTLVEVMIAMTIFAVFVSAIIFSQITNVNNSIRMSEDILLHNLAEMKMNESMLDLPEFTNALENTVKSKNFDIEGFKQYKYKIEYKKIEFPDFSQITGQTEDEDRKEDRTKKAIYEKMKKNIEKIIWQVKITVTNTESDYSYELNSWITNPKAKIDTNFTL